MQARFLFGLLAVVSILTPAGAQTGDTVGTASGDSIRAATHSVIVYYFHTNVRCPSCTKLEGLAGETVSGVFADEVRKGRIEFKSVNIEEGANAHFAKDYKFFGKMVVVSDIRDGTECGYKVLAKAWDLLNNPTACKKYIEREVRKFMQEKPVGRKK